MGDFIQIIKNALEYYDTNSFKYYDKMNAFKYYVMSNDSKKITFYDKNKNKINEYLCEIIGKYIPSQNIWIWGWSVSELNKNSINTSRKVLNYALDLGDNDILLKTTLITSRYQITSQIQIDIFLAIASFLSKKPMIFRLDYFSGYNPETNTNMLKILKKKNPINSFFLILKEIH